jgi:peptide/nickel transport system permease protein
MGRYLYDAVYSGETYEIMAWLTFTAILTILFNLIADIILGVIDPRIRLD